MLNSKEVLIMPLARTYFPLVAYRVPHMLREVWGGSSPLINLCEQIMAPIKRRSVSGCYSPGESASDITLKLKVRCYHTPALNGNIICQDVTVSPAVCREHQLPHPMQIYMYAYAYLSYYGWCADMVTCHQNHSPASFSISVNRGRMKFKNSINKHVNSWNITCTRIVRQHQIGTETGFDGWRGQTESNFH